MTTYRKIHGKAVNSLSSNPSSAEDAGRIFYNSTDNAFRSIVATEAWSSGGPLSTGRYASGSLGTQTAGVQIAGSSPTNVSNVEHYNGTGWSEETNYPAASQGLSGAGTQTAGIAYGGNSPSITANAFSYNGTAWTAANSLPYAANNIASCGLEKTNVIGAVGRDGSSGNSGTNKSVTFDGTNFANGPNINTTRMFNNSSGAGTGTAALIVGGFIDPSPNAMTNCEEYDGSSWTATGALNVATGFASAFGIQTNAVAQTNGSNYTATEGYDGSTWTTLPSMSVSSPGGLYGSSAGSTGDAGWVSSMGPAYKATEEFNRSANITTGAAWSSGGALNTARDEGASSQNGLQTAALYFGGYASDPASNATEQYDGTSWTSKNNLNTARYSGAGAGTTTAALYSGGFSNPSTLQSAVEEFDGTNWATQPNSLPSGRVNCGGCGLQTAALVFGGITPAPTRLTATEEYNGTSWTAGGAMPTAKSHFAGNVGIQTAALATGGITPGASYAATTEEYGGESWTAGGSLITGRITGGSAGIQTNAISFGGSIGPGTPGYSALTEGYDGTTFSTRPSLATARIYVSGTGTAAAGLAFGGNAPPYTTATEEFTGVTTAVNVKNISSS